MKRILHALFALALAVAPASALAQSSFFPGTGGGAVSNPADTFENCGIDGTNPGEGVTASTPGTAHTKAASWTNICASTASAWSGFYLYYSGPTSSTLRFLCDVSLDGGSTTKLANLYFQPGGSGEGQGFYYLPLQAAAGSTLAVKCQASAVTQSINFFIRGTISTGSNAPGFANADQLGTPDTANTRSESTINVPTSDTWTTITASTAQSYGAFVVVLGDSGTATAQRFSYVIGAGAGPTELARGFASTGSASPILRRTWLPVAATVAAGSAVKVKARANTTTDNLRPQVIGFR